MLRRMGKERKRKKGIKSIHIYLICISQEVGRSDYKMYHVHLKTQYLRSFDLGAREHLLYRWRKLKHLKSLSGVTVGKE